HRRNRRDHPRAPRDPREPREPGRDRDRLEYREAHQPARGDGSRGQRLPLPRRHLVLRDPGRYEAVIPIADKLRAPDVTTTTPDGNYRLDVDLAVAAYLADPDRFHKTTDDNPDGDPVLALVLE